MAVLLVAMRRGATPAKTNLKRVSKFNTTYKMGSSGSLAKKLKSEHAPTLLTHVKVYKDNVQVYDTIPFYYCKL